MNDGNVEGEQERIGRSEEEIWLQGKQRHVRVSPESKSWAEVLHFDWFYSSELVPKERELSRPAQIVRSAARLANAVRVPAWRHTTA